MVEGYKIQKKGKCTICTDCSRKLDINKRLKRQASNNGSNVTSLDTTNYAPEKCLVCKESITRAGNNNLDYPEQIATLLDKKFEDSGERFGGVIPIIDSEYTEEKVSDVAKKAEPIRTQHDPVIIELQPHEESLFNQVREFLDRLSTMSDIRYKTELIEDENDELALYEITAFKMQ